MHSFPSLIIKATTETKLTECIEALLRDRGAQNAARPRPGLALPQPPRDWRRRSLKLVG